MPLCPQVTNTPITVTLTGDFTTSTVVPLIADTPDGLAKNISDIDADAAAALAAATAATAAATAAAAAAATAQANATTALANAATAYNAAVASLQPSANTIVNASNQMTAIAANGITVFSGASSTTGARVVLNSLGLAGFNASNAATFSISATTGAAVFSGSVTGSTITGGTLNIAGNAIIDSAGLLTATGATITGTINAGAGYFGTSTNGFSVSATGLVGVGNGTIITSTASNAIILNAVANALQFKVAGVVSGNVLPLGTAGILMHYGVTPDQTGSTYPKVQLSFAAALLQGSASFYVQSTNSGNSALGEFRCFNTLVVDGSATFKSTMFAPNLSTSSSAENLRVATGSIGEIQETSASSIKFKDNVVDVKTVFDLDPKKLLDLPVRAFTYKEGYLSANDDRVNVAIPGFIAEEVDAIYPVAADYGQEGPHSWNERFIIPGMLALIQDLYKEIQTLKGE